MGRDNKRYRETLKISIPNQRCRLFSREFGLVLAQRILEYKASDDVAGNKRLCEGLVAAATVRFGKQNIKSERIDLVIIKENIEDPGERLSFPESWPSCTWLAVRVTCCQFTLQNSEL